VKTLKVKHHREKKGKRCLPRKEKRGNMLSALCIFPDFWKVGVACPFPERKKGECGYLSSGWGRGKKGKGEWIQEQKAALPEHSFGKGDYYAEEEKKEEGGWGEVGLNRWPVEIKKGKSRACYDAKKGGNEC